MEVIILESGDEVTSYAAERLCQLVHRKPRAVLGLPTGATPKLMYQKLSQFYSEGKADFANVTTFNLDEYVGVSADHPGSYAAYMVENFFRHVNVKPENRHIPNGLARDIENECALYEQKILDHGPIDLQVLGIGRDGHIGFNEPGSSLGSLTRLKTLTPLTRKDNQSHFSALEEVPMHVITMGVASIMKAQEILLLAVGESKASAVAATVEGPVTALVPASSLQFHPKVKVVIDQAAASLLQRRDYYRWVYQNKPSWQV